MAAKKRTGLVLLIVLLATAIAGAVMIFGSNVNAPQQGKFLYIPTGSTYDDVQKLLKQENILVANLSFDLLAKAAKYPAHVRAGKYKITPGMSNYTLVRMLRNGRQTPVKLVINKLRTKHDLFHLIGTQLEADSNELRAAFTNRTYLSGFGLDTNTAMCMVIPDTYEYYWNTNTERFLQKIGSNYKVFWNDERRKQAADKQLSIVQVAIIASLVEEETNAATDKPLIASVYINRLNKGIPLQADPTIKFALGDFSIKRITGPLLSVTSPYNTYLHTNLPPGPICTPSKKTIDAVLSSPETKFLFFCAKPELNGYSNFATNLADHMKNARAYQQALDARGIH